MRWVSKERITTSKRIENPQGRKTTSHPTTGSKEQKSKRRPKSLKPFPIHHTIKEARTEENFFTSQSLPPYLKGWNNPLHFSSRAPTISSLLDLTWPTYINPHK
jgi:hypothetical protein